MTPSQSDLDMAFEWCTENLSDTISEDEFSAKVNEVALEIANGGNLPLHEMKSSFRI